MYVLNTEKKTNSKIFMSKLHTIEIYSGFSKITACAQTNNYFEQYQLKYLALTIMFWQLTTSAKRFY